MTCDAVRNRILALADPRDVPDALRGHVAGCAACERWWHGVARLEGLLERLPAPPAAAAKAALLGDLAAARPAARRRPAEVAPEGGSPRKTGRYLAALAASVAVVGGVWVFTRGPGQVAIIPTPPKHALLESVVQRDLALARAGTPAEKLAALGGLADDLHAETRDLARVAPADDLKKLALWYDDVVQKGLVRQAERVAATPHAMTPADRVALFTGLAARLSDAGAEADRLSNEVPPGATGPLKRMAATARDGQQKLRQLAAGGGV